MKKNKDNKKRDRFSFFKIKNPWIELIRAYQARKLAEKDHYRMLINSNKVIAEQKVFDRKKLMFSKPCPINNNEKCFNECVHFCDGYVYYQSPLYRDDIGWWFRVYPKCRLWER